MKCKVCSAQWMLGNVEPYIYKCPICGEDFKQNKSSLISDNIQEFLIMLISDEGIEICKDKQRINGYLSDLFPSEINARDIVKQVLEMGIGEVLYDVLTGNIEKDKAESVILDTLNDITEYESRTKVVEVVRFLGKFDKVSNESVNIKEYYVRQLKVLQDDTYRIIALEKALGFDDDAALSLELSKLKEKAGLVEEAKVLKEKSAELGNADSLYEVAITLLESDYFQAIEKLELAADAGNEKASFKLYQLYYRTQDNKKNALDNLKKAAFLNYVPAMYEYGLHLLYGDDVQEDVTSAIKFLEECALKGDYDAKSKLKYMYSVGYKVQKDFEKAKQYR